MAVAAAMGAVTARQARQRLPVWFWVVGILALLFILSGKGRGVRYLLPVTVPASAAAAVVISRWRWGPVVAVACPILLLTELAFTLDAQPWPDGLLHPRHLTFFNLATSALGPKHQLLGDSNLDWGQTYQYPADIGPVYVAAFGTVAPTYGIAVVPGYFLGPTPKLSLKDLARPDARGTLLVSATIWQATYLTDETKADYLRLQSLPPDRVLEDGALLAYQLPLRLPDGPTPP
jgi:hypothetical protein